MGIFDRFNAEGYEWGGIANDPTKKGQEFAGRDKLASDIGSMANMLQRVQLGANDARYQPFTGVSTQKTMSVSPTTLLRGGREAQAGLFKQEMIDQAKKNQGAQRRDTSTLQGLEGTYKGGAQMAQGSLQRQPLMFNPQGY